MTKNRRTVRRAFDSEALKRICVIDDFSEYAEKVVLKPHKSGRERFYWYRDNGSKILAIAHLDSVHDNGTCRIVNTEAGLLAVSGTLDDRLGAYVILDMLPKLGIQCDILLTTDEEIGATTASEFVTDKQYNWLIQFDRGGRDVVMYDYETPELVKLVSASGAHVGQGSFSDICRLEHLGCAGFNWGVGYYEYHGPRAHAWLSETFMMVSQFMKFHAAHHDVRFEHDEYITYRWNKSWDKYTWGDAPLDFCPACGTKLHDEFCSDCNMSWTDNDEDLASNGDDFTAWMQSRAVFNDTTRITPLEVKRLNLRRS